MLVSGAGRLVYSSSAQSAARGSSKSEAKPSQSSHMKTGPGTGKCAARSSSGRRRGAGRAERQPMNLSRQRGVAAAAPSAASFVSPQLMVELLAREQQHQRRLARPLELPFAPASAAYFNPNSLAEQVSRQQRAMQQFASLHSLSCVATALHKHQLAAASSNQLHQSDQQNVEPKSSGSSECLRPPKSISRSKRESRKCRKVYGMQQRQLWCTQCKWKKACSRFCDRAQQHPANGNQVIQAGAQVIANQV